MENINTINIDGIECYEKDGIAYLKLETVAKGLGFTETKNEKEYVMWRRVDAYLNELGFGTSAERPEYIPENIFYRLAMKARNEVAERFQAKVADEIIPSIRRTGSYLIDNKCNELSIQTQFILQIAQNIAQKELADKKRDREIACANEKAEKAIKATEKIKDVFVQTYDNWRDDINRLVRKISQSSGIPYQQLFSEMYVELESNGYNLAQRQRNKIERMKSRGCKKSEIERETSKIAIIEDDKKAKKIFSDIVSRYAVKYID